jgi:hypothetical protein
MGSRLEPACVLQSVHSVRLLGRNGSVIQNWDTQSEMTTVLLFTDARWALLGDTKGLVHLWRLPNRRGPKP